MGNATVSLAPIAATRLRPPPAGCRAARRAGNPGQAGPGAAELVHLAIIHCVPAVALCCIAQLPREVLEIQNDLFQTPLHLAVYLEQPSVIQALMHKGVNPGLQDRNGNTPLHLACEQQCLRLVHLAIIHCVPAVALCCIAQLPREVLEIQNDLFQTPLHLAVYLEQPSVIQALMHKGVNPGLQDRNGNTPLHLACEQQCLRCAQQLLQDTGQPHRHHQDLQLQNWQGLACLHISTLKGNIPMMSLLLQRGANIDVREGTSGKTPLHLAVECHNRRAVQFLLRHGAYVDAQMYNGCTPLHLAVGRRDAAIAAILSHSGADTLLRNMENETAQDLADGNDDLLALLPFDDLKISGKPVVCSE
ncbi:PREDICTED: NF-kappa-B inhibitor epsilon-like [Chaetura pelagica]|uniref:NF-kappa-B inhibitor epsilon-like n=1 Tax=Chaetura pelagica TaxID=8897 RepID=UPI000523D68B|nr:PREDICTED: NF-kappa-B inhibitor epsilon-like [Chaetura pelagica]